MKRGASATIEQEPKRQAVQQAQALAEQAEALAAQAQALLSERETQAQHAQADVERAQARVQQMRNDTDQAGVQAEQARVQVRHAEALLGPAQAQAAQAQAQTALVQAQGERVQAVREPHREPIVLGERLRAEFRYSLCLDKDLCDSPWIWRVGFESTFYGGHEVLKFDKLLNEEQAVQAVEAWLSQPMDRDYWKRVHPYMAIWEDGTLMWKDGSFEEFLAHYPIRGSCLEDWKNLNDIQWRGNWGYQVEFRTSK